MSQYNPQPKSLPGGSVSTRPHKEGGTSHGRIFAALAYVLPLVGGIIGLQVDGANPLTRVHARQSIGAVLALILAFFVWVVAGYIIGMIPFAGPILAIALFSLVIAMAIFLVANWLISLAQALRGEERTIPFANRIVVRLFGDEAPSKLNE